MQLRILLAALLLPLWLFPYLPLTDWSEHLLAARILVDYDDPDSGYAAFFITEIPSKPYSTTHFWFVALLRPLMDVDASTRLYLSVALILTILALEKWVDRSAPERKAQLVPATMVLYSLLFYIGMVNFLFAIPFLFLSLVSAWRLGEKERPWGWTLSLSICLLLVYFSHIVAFALALSFLGVQWLAGYPRGRLLWMLGAAAPSLVLLTLFFTLEWGGGVGEALEWRYDPLWIRLVSFLLPLGVAYDSFNRSWIYPADQVVVWSIVLTLVLIGWKLSIRREQRPARQASVLLAVAACAAASVVFLPSYVAGNLAIAFRVAYPAGFLLILLLPAGWSQISWTRWGVFAACLAAPLLLTIRIAQFQVEMRDLMRVIDRLPPHQVIQPVITEPNDTYFRNYPFLHAANWYNLQKGGTNPYTFTRFPYFPIQDRRRFIEKTPGEWTMDRFHYREHQAGTDYFLVRTRNPAILADLEENLTLAAHFGDWMAFGPNLSRAGEKPVIVE